MSITKSLKIQNCIIVGGGITPSVFTQYWFIKNQIFGEDDLTPDCIFTKDLVQIRSIKKVRVLIIQNQIQINVEDGASLESAIESTAIPLIQKIGTSSYLAAGINFIWFLKDTELNLTDLSNKLFKNDRLEITKYFNNPDSSFGIYQSKNILGSRLKLDIKPVNAIDLGLAEKEEVISFAFNFHKDLATNTLNQNDLIEYLGLCKAFVEESDKLMALYN